jgi:hypothetical protein
MGSTARSSISTTSDVTLIFFSRAPIEQLAA